MHKLRETIAATVLLCGAITLIWGIAIQIRPRNVQTDAGVGLDAGHAYEGITVVIDAGHGGEDGGTQSADGLLEKEVNLRIAALLNDMLRSNGIATVMTRTEDILLYDRNVDYHGHKKMLDLAARRKIAEETENAVFISIHMNSYPEAKYHGLQVFYSPHDPQSQELAARIQQDAQAFLQPDNHRKIKSATSGIYLLDRLHCPAVLVECGFLSNPSEAARFATEECRQEIAFLLFCSIMSYISDFGA